MRIDSQVDILHSVVKLNNIIQIVFWIWCGFVCDRFNNYNDFVGQIIIFIEYLRVS